VLAEAADWPSRLPARPHIEIQFTQGHKTVRRSHMYAQGSPVLLKVEATLVHNKEVEPAAHLSATLVLVLANLDVNLYLSTIQASYL